MSDSINDLVAQLKGARKYALTCEDTLRRTAAWALARHPSAKEALKAAKRKLHQITAAYMEPSKWREVEDLVGRLPTGRPEMTRSICRRILAHHASTAERLEIMEGAFADVFRVTGLPGVVMDLACGLNPFALPWMGLSSECVYHAVDINHRLVQCVNRFFEALGRPQAAECRDVLATPPTEHADIALLLKTLPCLEQQEKGASARVLRTLDCRWIVLSFPSRSLGGRQKGMAAHYGRFMERLLDELGGEAKVLTYPDELFYIIRGKR